MLDHDTADARDAVGTALEVTGILLQHHEGQLSEEELWRFLDAAFDDLTIDETQATVLALGSLLTNLIAEYAHASGSVTPTALLQAIALSVTSNMAGDSGE